MGSIPYRRRTLPVAGSPVPADLHARRGRGGGYDVHVATRSLTQRVHGGHEVGAADQRGSRALSPSRAGRSHSSPSGCHTLGAGGVFMSITSTGGATMASTTRIPKTEITGLHGYLLKRFTRKLLGDLTSRS